METSAGWYPDPLSRHERRLWDGAVWTRWTRDAQVVEDDPLGADECCTAIPPNDGMQASLKPPNHAKNLLVGLAITVLSVVVGSASLSVAFSQEDWDPSEKTIPGWLTAAAGVLAFVCLVAFLFGVALFIVSAAGAVATKWRRAS
jgi:hypothetical protein